MRELDEVWENFMNEAIARAKSSGRGDVAGRAGEVALHDPHALLRLVVTLVTEEDPEELGAIDPAGHEEAHGQ